MKYVGQGSFDCGFVRSANESFAQDDTLERVFRSHGCIAGLDDLAAGQIPD
jgi:hypothetical protein